MIGRQNADGADVTPRSQGKLAGSPWTAIGTGTDDILIGPQVPCPASADRTVRISYEVRGRYSTTGTILVVGQANVTIPAGSDPVITEDVRTFDDARVTWYVDIDAQAVQLQVTQDASDDWELQTKVAYDLIEPTS